MSATKLTVRTSSLPQLMICTPSVLNPEKFQQVDVEIEPALVGTLVHAQCQSVVETGAYDMSAVCQRVSEADCQRAYVLFNNFIGVWAQASKNMPNPLTEISLRSETDTFILTGHIDACQINKEDALILDYKTGRQHEDHYHQMMGYAYLIWVKQGRPKTYTIHVTTVYLEDKSITPYTFDAKQMADWEVEVTEKLKDMRYTVGRKCAFCQIQGSCKAYPLYVGGAIRALTQSEAAPQWGDLSPDERGELSDGMYVVEKAIERAKTGLRDLVKKQGELDIGHGKVYTLVATKTRVVNASRAQAVLNREIPDHHRLAKYSLDDLLVAVARRLPKGTKTEGQKAFLALLEQAGAVSAVESTRMYRRPAGEQQMKE